MTCLMDEAGGVTPPVQTLTLSCSLNLPENKKQKQYALTVKFDKRVC